MTRALVYLRRSKRTEGGGIETQRAECRRYCEARGWAVVAEFEDDGVSGARDRRPGLDALRAAVRRGEAGAVVVFRLDRLARSTRHAVVMLDELRAAGADFVSVTEGMDTSTPIGRALFTIVAALAELERDSTRERIGAGLDRAKRAGKRLGRPRADFDVAQAQRLRAAGKPRRVICAPTGSRRADPTFAPRRRRGPF